MNPNHLIPHLSTDKDPQDFQARFSKWITIDLLIDEIEMKDLLSSISPTHLISPQNACPKTPFLMNEKKLIETYSSYILELKSQNLPSFDSFKKFFYLMIAASLEGLFIRNVGRDKKALTINSPLIEVKPISLIVSSIDRSIRTSAVNPEGILWGLSLSFPQIMQDPKTLESIQINFQKHPTGVLFKKIRTFIATSTGN